MQEKRKEAAGEQASNKEIIVQTPQEIKFDPERDVKQAQAAAKALMTVIDATKPLTMQGKRYLYFEHWQTVAKFFNTTVGISETIKQEDGYIAKAIVYDKNGVIIGGAEASCMRDEQNWKNKPDFQLRSMAQTRAMAKALRSIFGFVAVLAGVEATPAEEMNDYPKAQSKKSLIDLPIKETAVTHYSAVKLKAFIEMASEAQDKDKLENLRQNFANNRDLYNEAETALVRGAFERARESYGKV